MKQRQFWIFGALLPCVGGVIILLSSIPECVSLSGVLDYRNVSCLAAPFGGEMLQVFVRPGQHVEPGDVLFQMDAGDLEEDLATLYRQQALQKGLDQALGLELALAERTRDAEQSLLKNAIASYEYARESLSVREGERRQKELELSLYRHASNLLRLKTNFQESRIQSEELIRKIAEVQKKIRLGRVISPGKGVFLRAASPLDTQGVKEIRVGQVCPEGAVLGFVADPGTLELKAEIDPQFRQRLLLLDPVSVRIPAQLNGGKDQYRQERILEFPTPDQGGKSLLRISWKGGAVMAGTPLELKISLRPQGGKL